MNYSSYICVLLVGLSCSRCPSHVSASKSEPDTADWMTTLKTLHDGIKTMDTFLDVARNVFDGDGGPCRYRCADGYKPVPRPGYKQPPPNGCGSPMFGFQFDIGIPSLNKCCNQHDRCYDTCGREKHDCDGELQLCLKNVCRDVQNALGFDQSVQGCDSTVNLLLEAVKHLGCKLYLNSQKESCVCPYEERSEL
ncbi:group XIIA secretory phospholipase A2-like [Chelmon rostratus]|uniref:group XIIA secretory phospholipase A2-like n=1 Tax=Chelmon rostratus TaxID=109905 RepID=UPI001BE4EEA0|nr:group XIIA secretory phospholipase A2-like [Chelmon rostratus]